MKYRMSAILALAAVVLVAGGLAAQDKKAPDTILYETKAGNVTFPHAKHVETVKGDCKTCHTALFQESKGNLGYKEAMHKKAETSKTSCGACHHAGGKAFESKANCAKCHVKA